MVWKAYVEFGWKVPRSRPENNQTRISDYPPIIPPLFCHYLEAEVGIALRHCVVPILTTPVQINQLRSFPSKIRLPEVFAKIKNYPASSRSKFSHYSSSIILLELLLEVVLVSSKFLRGRNIIPSRMMQSQTTAQSLSNVGPEKNSIS